MQEYQPLTLMESLKLMYKFKDVKRKGWLIRGVPEDLCESDLGHSYRCSQAAFHYTRDSRTTAMLVVHDLPELIEGDTTPFDGVSPEEKNRLETKAMYRITSPLPLGDSIMNLWLEYEEGKTPRAKIAKQLDRLDAAVMAFKYEHMGYKVSEFYPYCRKRLQDPTLIEILDTLLKKEHHLPDSHKVYFKLLDQARKQMKNKRINTY